MSIFRDVVRLLDPRHLVRRLQVHSRGPGTRQVFYFVTHNRNHIRLMVGAAVRIKSDGHPVYFVYLDGKKRGGLARPELDSLGLPSISFEELCTSIRPRDVLVTGNDFGPWAPYKHFLDSINRGLVTVIGVIEGARAIRRHRYDRVDYIVAPGPAANEHFSKPVHTVGSPVIERQLAKSGTDARAGRFVLINFKGNPENENDRRDLSIVAEACSAMSVPYTVSVHPNIAMRLPQASSAEFSDLLPDALALVTRPSTTAYEAMAVGVPVVIFPPAQPLVEFAVPYGAFTHSAPDTLVADLKKAIASRPHYKDACAKFLNRHLSIDPEVDADTRTANAILKISSVGVEAKPR